MSSVSSSESVAYPLQSIVGLSSSLSESESVLLICLLSEELEDEEEELDSEYSDSSFSIIFDLLISVINDYYFLSILLSYSILLWIVTGHDILLL